MEGHWIGRPDSVFPESADRETVEPAVDDAGLGSGVEARSGEVSIGDAVFEWISRGPSLRQARGYPGVPDQIRAGVGAGTVCPQGAPPSTTMRPLAAGRWPGSR